jgi:hypothetical protein
VRAEKYEFPRSAAERHLRGRPEGSGVLMRAVLRASPVVSGFQHAHVLHHRVVPRDELLGELARLTRAGLITKMAINIHVTPTL